MNVLDGTSNVIIAPMDGLARLADVFVSTIPSGLLFLLLILFAGCTWILSKKVKQLNSIVNDLQIINRSSRS